MKDYQKLMEFKLMDLGLQPLGRAHRKTRLSSRMRMEHCGSAKILPRRVKGHHSPLPLAARMRSVGARL